VNEEVEEKTRLPLTPPLTQGRYVRGGAIVSKREPAFFFLTPPLRIPTYAYRPQVQSIVPMNTHEIDTLCFGDQILGRIFHGTVPCDRLPEVVDTVGAVCVNTGSSASAGVHWQSLFWKRGTVYFFDSFGRPPSGVVRRWCLRHFSRVIYNRVRHQRVDAATCGAYAIYHLMQQARGRSFALIIRDFVRIANDDVFVASFVGSLRPL